MKSWAIYTHLPINAIVRLPHPRGGDSQGQETFLAPSADKHTCSYNTRVPKPPSLAINPKVKGFELQEDEMVIHIYTFTSNFLTN